MFLLQTTEEEEKSPFSIFRPIDADTMYSIHGEFDLKNLRTYYTDVVTHNSSEEKYTYRKLYYELTFRRKWQFYGLNLVRCTLLWEFYV